MSTDSRQSPQVITLDGSWLIRPDPDNTGLTQDWFRGIGEDKTWKTIQVPSSWHIALGDDATGVVWYARRITLPESWIKSGRVPLRFESVATEARVWANGHEVGSHVGDYIPFQFDITDQARSTPKQQIDIIVRVDQIHAPPPPAGVLVQNGHITKGFHDLLSLQHAGIWGSVALHRTPGLSVAPNGISIRADPATRKINIEVEFEGAAANEFVPFTILNPDGEVCGGAVVELKPGQQRLQEEIDLECPVSLWSPNSPNLYTLNLDLASAGSGPDRPIETHSQRFAFRTITTGGPENSHILLNGTPICIRGILHWGHEPSHIAPAPPPDQIREEFKRLRELGFNCVCLCMWYAPEHFYDIADETGMLIWQEHPIWKSPMGDEHIPEYQRMFEAFFRRDRRHPSVILVSGSCEHEAFNKKLAAWWWQRAHELLPDRLLQVQTAFFNWTDPDQTDLYDEHVYDNSGRWVRFLDDVQTRIKELKPKPFIMGETIISNAWPDIESYRARLGDQHPWWVTRGLAECAQFETKVAERFGAETLQRFRRQADRFGKQYRKFQAELFRMNPRNAGWVMNHIRDVPQCRCGFKDDFEEWRWTPGETQPWLAESPVLLWTPEHQRGFIGGRKLPISVGVSNFSPQPIHGNLLMGAGYEPCETERKQRAFAGQRLEVPCGAVRALDIQLPLPAVDKPNRLSAHASVDGAGDNAWDLWIFPAPSSPPPGTIRLSGLPFTDAERDLEFEEKAYSAGWGLPCRTWKPSLPDPAILLPQATAWNHDSPIPPNTRVFITHRLTTAIAEFIRTGGRALLLASRHAGGFGSKFINLYGQVPLVIERDDTSWPVAIGESDWVVDLLHHDLTRNTARAIPVEDFGIQDTVDPIIRLVFTHDSGTPKLFDAAFAARVDRGLLVVTTLDHSTEAGQYLLHRLLRFAAESTESTQLPLAALDINRWLT